MIINGGTGNGYAVGVNEENSLKVSAITTTVEHHMNHHDGLAYNLIFSATPTATGDCFVYIKNTDDADMSFEGIDLWNTASEYIDIKLNDSGTATGGTAITPINSNAGSGNEADGTFEAGANITGLSGGKTAYRIYHKGSTGMVHYNFEQDIILPKNKTLTLYAELGGTPLGGNIIFNCHTVDLG